MFIFIILSKTFITKILLCESSVTGNVGRESNLQASEGYPLSIRPPPRQEPASLLPTFSDL